MRAHHVFARMTPERATELLRAVAEKSPVLYAQALAAASQALRARPVYLQRQPPEKRAEAVRRAMARVASADAAEEILATYFLECRRPLLVEWLDLLGLEHEDGALAEDPAAPDSPSLRNAVETFRGRDDDPDRDLLLQAFAAQSAVEWPELDALLG